MTAQLTFRTPGLPGDDGRVQWTAHSIDYVRGRSLAGYLGADLHLPLTHVSHVIVDGRSIEPSERVTVPVPETKWQRRWRRFLDRPTPTVEVSVFDQPLDRLGIDARTEIFVVPIVDGKNSAVILGAVGAVIGFYLGGAPGSKAGWTLGYGAIQGAMAGYAIGSTIGALITPKPRMIKEAQDGPTSYTWAGIDNDARAGVPRPIMLGERLVGGMRIGAVRRRSGVVPVRAAPGDWDQTSPTYGSEILSLQILVAAHQTWGPVGVTSPNDPANVNTNKPDIRINGQHYSNFPSVKVDWRTGTAGQSVIPGFNVVANTFNLAVDLTALAGSWHTYTTSSTQVDALEVLLEMPGGISHTDNTAGLQKNTTKYQLEYRKVGDSTWLKFDYDDERSLVDHSRAKRLETRRVEGLVRGQYEVRARWLSATYTDISKDTWQVWLSGVTEETQDSRSYPGESIIGIKGLATDQLSGPMPVITSLWRGAIPQKWSSGGGFAAADWGVGQTAPAGRNPHWLTLWLMRNKDVGAGNEISDSEIDLPAFKTGADYSDELETVEPEGSSSYTEARFQFDAYIDQQQPTVDLLQQILSTCRSSIIFAGNKWSVGVDKPGVLTQYFGMGSIKLAGETADSPSTFSQQFKSERHEVNCFDATFDDRAAEWETETHTECIDNRNEASYTTSFSGSNNDLTITSKAMGDAGAAVSIAFVVAGNNTPLSIGVAGNAITVNVATNGGGAATSTAAQVKTAIEASSPANALVTVTHAIGRDGTANDGTGVVAALPATNLRLGLFRTDEQLVGMNIPVLRRQMSFWGVTRRTQVSRELRFNLRQSYALREFGSFGASTKSMLCQVFDLIGISHDVPQYGYSGRVRDGSLIDLVMFDRDVPFESGTTYSVLVAYKDPGPDGKDFFETRTVAETVPPGDSSSYFGVRVTTPFTRIPAEYEEWFYGPVGKEVRPARIVDIDRDADDQRAVSYAEYNASVYDVSGPLTIPSFSLLPDFAAPPGAIPELKAFSEITARNDGRRVTTVILQWTRPNPARTEGPYKGARLDYSFDNLNWTTLASVDGVEYRWEDAPHGILIYFRVVPYSISGKYNHLGAAYTSHTPIGFGDPSPIVTGISAGYAEGAFWVAWSALGPEYEYEVRQANPANWTTDQTGFLWRGKAVRFLDESPDARSITYYVRARDPFGNYSSASTSVAVNDTAPAAPTITTITRFKDSLKIRVTPPGGVTDLVAIHLHASQSPAFTPSAANRVAGTVGAAGGEFLFRTGTAGLWYFKATCEDWLSQRMNDWIYTTEEDDNIIVIQPVNPGSVTLSTPTTDASGGDIIKDPIGRERPIRKVIAPITWTHTDVTNPAGSLIGFEVIVYTTSVDKPKARVTVSDPTKRLINVPELAREENVTLYAAVKALYVDGLTSDLITSTGQTIPQETNPTLRDSDDRNVAGYAESFDSASLPTGILINGGSHVISGGVITVTATGSNPNIQWNTHTWADAYLDTRRGGSGTAGIRIKCSVAGAQLEISTSNGSNVTIDLITDGNFHTYRVPAGVVLSTGSFAVNFYVNLTAGQTFAATMVALLFESLDLEWDGHVDRGVQARNNFDRDPDGDGMRMISPVRVGMPGGNVIAVQENGLFFLRDENGDLISETAYKLGRNGRIENYAHSATIDFGDVGDWGINIAIPQPSAYNKCRVIIQDVGSDILPASAPAATVIRRWFEACNFGEYVGKPGFMVAGAFFFGGTLQHHRVIGPWTQSQQAKSSLTLAADAATTDANDAWYYVQDDGLPNDTTSPDRDFYFRIVVWLTVEMPTSKRTNGSYHYADLEFTVRAGDATLSGNQMNLGGLADKFGPFKARLLADGTTKTIPIVVGRESAADLVRDRQNVKVDWHAQTWESGGSGTITCEIESIDWTYIEQCKDVHLVNGADIGFTWLEEFGG